MKTTAIFAGCLLIAARLAGFAAEPAPPALPELPPVPSPGARILLVTGIDYPGHLWRQTAPVLKNILEQDARLRVRIIENPLAVGAPRLRDWDAVILHLQTWETNGPGPAARENLTRYVQGGKGLMLTHFACGAWYGEWPDFEKIAGRVWFGPQGGRQHDPHGKFTVTIADPNHPITKGMAAFDTWDELYTCLIGTTPIHIVAQAKSKVDQKDYPMAFVLQPGQGRTFHTVLGHDVRAYTNNPAVGDLMRRGCAWAAGLK